MTTVRKAICLMGPTASGKTEIAIALCKRFPFEIISVDSAMVYRGMDIGTAKPDAAALRLTPHRLVDIRAPEDPYSAGDFVRDAMAAIDEISSAGRIPLLVGGTMMYFRALTEGIASLPGASPTLRAAIEHEARAEGWPAMHAQLAQVDPQSAARIKPADRQRIQRALEVYRQSGLPLSVWQRSSPQERPGRALEWVKVGLNHASRQILHDRIRLRLNLMINNGLVDEVKTLFSREGLSADAPSMRSVGYRQFWSHLAGDCSHDEAAYRALVASRQLAKRQITWLRSEPDLVLFDPLEADVIDAISAFLIPFLDA
jgi:tRNA dimethylallyltransferase